MFRRVFQRKPSVRPDVLRTRVEEITKSLGSLTGVSMILVVNPDGRELYRWYRTTADRSRIKLDAADAMDFTKRASEFLLKTGDSTFSDLIIRTERSVAIIQSAGDAMLVTIADRAANLALLLIRSRAAAEELSGLRE